MNKPLFKALCLSDTANLNRDANALSEVVSRVKKGDVIDAYWSYKGWCRTKDNLWFDSRYFEIIPPETIKRMRVIHDW